MDITILGTSSMVPTKDRNHTSIYIDLGRSAILVDCGEGTQRQLKIANLSPQKIKAIFLSHWHGDHVLGLPGLIQTMAAQGYDGTLTIYGPPSTKEHMDFLFKAFVFDKAINILVKEIGKDGHLANIEKHAVSAYEVAHSVTTFGFVVQEPDKRKMNVKILDDLGIRGEDVGKLQQGKSLVHKGKTIHPDAVSTLVSGKRLSIIVDTTLSSQLLTIAKDADLLICESTYGKEMEDKAEEYKHLTASQAAQIASHANVKKLVLTHFSSRYKQVDHLVEEAKTIFPETLAAHDFLKITL